MAFPQFYSIILILFCLNLYKTHKTYVYYYTTNITENSHKEMILQSISGDVYITPIIIKEMNDTMNELYNKTLWYITLNITTNNNTTTNKDQFIDSFITLNGLILFDYKGLIDRIYIPQFKSIMYHIQLNLFKGLLSLFNIHNTFEPGYEIDSSGKCYVTYAILSSNLTTINDNHNFIIIDKEKKFCQRLSYSIDIWNENLLKIIQLKEIRQLITRYIYDKFTYQIYKIQGYERQIYSMTNDTLDSNYGDYNGQYKQFINSTGIDLITWQQLEFIHEMDTYNHYLHHHNNNNRIEEMIKKQYDLTLNEIIELLFDSNYQMIHLGLIYPITKSTKCSLNVNLFNHSSDNNDDNDNNNYHEELIHLRQSIESYRDSLQTDLIGTIQSSEAVLHLIDQLRCLPNTNQSITMLNSVTMLSPPSIDTHLIYRQLNTWKDQLIDILINCGTNVCLTIVFNRLNALTQFIDLNNPNQYNKNSIEIIKTKELLYKKLWPSLSHMNQLNIEQINQLYQFCEKSINIDQNYVCLMTLVNLNSRIENYEQFDYFKQIIKHIEHLLNLSNHNHNLLLTIGISLSKQLHYPNLTNSLLELLFNDQLPSIIHTLIIQAIGEIHFSKDSNHHSNKTQLIEITTKLIEIFLTIPIHFNNEILINYEIFKLLLLSSTSYLSSIEITYLLRQLSKQQRWTLIKLCRQLINHWCQLQVLNNHECDCLNGLLPKCQLYLAGSWYGLIGDHNYNQQLKLIGKSILLHNELIHINNQLLIDYHSYLVYDSYNGLKLSNFMMNLISKDDEILLFNFNIQANELNNLINLSSRKQQPPSSSSSSTKTLTTSTSTTTTTGETWVNYDLNYLGISLLPNELFSGGLSNLMKLFLSITNQFTSLLKIIQLPIDQRIQTTISSGWLIQIDHLTIFTMNILNAIETNLWYFTGRNNLRSKIGLINDIKIHLVQFYNEDNTMNMPRSQLYIHKGNAIQGYIDFITNIHINHLPDSICLSMNQGVNTFIVQWYTMNNTTTTQYSSSTTIQNPSSPPSSSPSSPSSSTYHYISNYTLQPVSYFLGYDNSLQCNKMKAKTIW
ncbi:unnamed protein product [Schistosoma margrebowiei]|uniref:Vitellogenin domain-containing protein n=1 Tax=Schistosoma margrebowiei TaxID=48269 RepID=A0AA85AG82_9TREM|nr:unnamed protein product [Schistosoma margrebowiei]